jgi:hypothetical protein
VTLVVARQCLAVSLNQARTALRGTRCCDCFCARQIPGTTEWMAGSPNKPCVVTAAKGSAPANVGGVSNGLFGAAAMELRTGADTLPSPARAPSSPRTARGEWAVGTRARQAIDPVT